ncbi:MAG: hypothetical protein LBJ32_02905, partial [Oscillospiraceae bacterium]|nr:hypothetical protein [Oscillospiraceae bacterium]
MTIFLKINKIQTKLYFIYKKSNKNLKYNLNLSFEKIIKDKIKIMLTKNIKEILSDSVNINLKQKVFLEI